MDIQDYPNLKQVLADVINAPHDGLEHFNICCLPPLDREALKLAYIKDADEDEIQSVINTADIAKEVKRGVSADIAMQNFIFEKIYDIAQLMGPYLREIERSNNQEDRINE